MDESTNHVDIETLESMSAALNQYEGSVVMVSHNQGKFIWNLVRTFVQWYWGMDFVLVWFQVLSADFVKNFGPWKMAGCLWHTVILEHLMKSFPRTEIISSPATGPWVSVEEKKRIVPKEQLSKGQVPNKRQRYFKESITKGNGNSKPIRAEFDRENYCCSHACLN
jgi:hypothetical protein